MAPFSVLLTYDARVREESPRVLQRIRDLVSREIRWEIVSESKTPYGYPIELEDPAVSEVCGGLKVSLGYSTTWDEVNMTAAVRRVRQAQRAVEHAAKDVHDWWGLAVNGVAPFAAELARAKMQAEVRVPVRAVDYNRVTDAGEAWRLVEASLREEFPFTHDQDEFLRNIDVLYENHSIVLTGSPDAAVSAAVAYLAAPRPKPALPAPAWAWASVAIALLSFFLSWASISALTLGALILLSSVIAVAAVRVGASRGANPWVTLGGVAPVLVFVSFACGYAAIGYWVDRTLITIDGAPLDHLREPLLLSLSLMTTVGVLDLEVHDWVRSIAYFEMLLVAAVAGGAAVVAFRRVSRRIREMVDAVQADLRPGDRG